MISPSACDERESWIKHVRIRREQLKNWFAKIVYETIHRSRQREPLLLVRVFGPSSLLCSCNVNNNNAISVHALLHYVLSVFARRTMDLPATRASCLFPPNLGKCARIQKTNNETATAAVKGIACAEFSFFGGIDCIRHTWSDTSMCSWNELASNEISKMRSRRNRFPDCMGPCVYQLEFMKRRYEPIAHRRFSATCAVECIEIVKGKFSEFISIVRALIAIRLLNLTSLSFHTW